MSCERLKRSHQCRFVFCFLFLLLMTWLYIFTTKNDHGLYFQWNVFGRLVRTTSQQKLTQANTKRRRLSLFLKREKEKRTREKKKEKVPFPDFLTGPFLSLFTMNAANKRVMARIIYIGSMLLTLIIYLFQDDFTITVVLHFCRMLLSMVDKWIAYHNWTYSWWKLETIKEGSVLNALTPLTAFLIFIQWECEGTNNQICRLVQLVSATCSLAEATLDELIYISKGCGDSSF